MQCNSIFMHLYGNTLPKKASIICVAVLACMLMGSLWLKADHHSKEVAAALQSIQGSETAFLHYRLHS